MRVSGSFARALPMNRCAVVHLALDPGLMLDPEGGARRAQGHGAGEGARRPACPPPGWGWRLGLALGLPRLPRWSLRSGAEGAGAGEAPAVSQLKQYACSSFPKPKASP